MRLKGIVVTGLFDMFDQVIPLNHTDRITIVHGPNGYGKTTILRLVDALFNDRRVILRTTPFKQLEIEFDDGSRLTLSPRIEGKARKLEYSLETAARKHHWTEEPMDPRAARFPLAMVEQEIPDLERVGPQTWRDVRTHQLLDLGDVYAIYREVLPYFPSARHEHDKPDWLNEVLKSASIRHIEAQRLLRIAEGLPHAEQRRRPTWSAAVDAYSQDLAAAIKSKLAESAALSQSLDRTFPQRLVNLPQADVLAESELLSRLNSIEEHRQRLTEAGLLDPQHEPAFQVPYLNEHEKRVLSVWVRDVEIKLGVYKELAAKIELLKKIVNEHFRFKVVQIDKEQGFVFRTHNQTVLPPTSLSSGEQHVLVLLYELLFKVKEDALVLIDEPELSLHVEWQLRFLADLASILQLAPFDVLIATHSPQIINERWDLTVKLADPQSP
jgi:ABC-type transport system involved in cytochrome c biogenesis ATPase subunit